MIALDQLIQLVEEIDAEDPIDWGMLNISEQEATKLIALDVLDMFKDTNEDTRDQIMLATVTKLILENFVLNLKLQEVGKDGRKTF